MEAALRDCDELLRLAHDASGMGHWDWNVRTGEMNWCRQCLALYGLPQDTVMGYERLLQTIHPDDRDRIAAALQRAIDERSSYDEENRTVWPDGSIHWTASRGKVFCDPSGDPVRLVGVTFDITERRRMQSQLVESQNLVNALIEGTEDLVFLKDLEGHYRIINSVGARINGRPVADMLGKTDADLYPADMAARIREEDLQVMATGRTLRAEEPLKVAGGSMRTFQTTKSVHRDAQGAAIGVIGIVRDVTRSRKLERQLQQAQKMEAIGRLAGGVSHDLNNVLTAISGFSELLGEQLSKDDPSRPYLEEIQRAGERAAKVTRQLLAFSRKQVLQPRVVDLNVLLTELLGMLTPLIGEDVELRLFPRAALGRARVDPGQFEQAIVNLVVNARDAMPHGGVLHIETRDIEAGEERPAHVGAIPGPLVMVAVSDSGAGIEEYRLSRVFEPFYTTKELGHGTGLGLAMVYGFVTQSGGFIEVSSDPGKGTRFEIYLSRADEGARPEPPSPVSRESQAQGETILLAEDEGAVRKLARHILEARGYTILEASDGEDALRIADRHDGPIDLLLTDVVMPRMGGRELRRRLVSQRPRIRTLFLSGYMEETSAIEGQLGSGASFLQKPFDSKTLARRVRDVLDAREDRQRRT